MIQAAAVKIAAGALIASGVVGVSAAEHCKLGEVATSLGCGKVTQTLPDETKGGSTTSAVTVPVDFRDADGNRTSSGLGVNDQFHWLGGKKQGKNGDGLLIEIRQTTHGGGGWGPLYEGWIPVKFTQIPSMFH
jgi:hypothetical protein